MSLSVPWHAAFPQNAGARLMPALLALCAWAAVLGGFQIFTHGVEYKAVCAYLRHLPWGALTLSALAAFAAYGAMIGREAVLRPAEAPVLAIGAAMRAVAPPQAALLKRTRAGRAGGARRFGVALAAGLTAAELLFAALGLWVLMPHGAPGLPGFVALVSAARLAGIAARTPAGLGAFDLVIALGSFADASASLGALTFAVGVLLVISGATPAYTHRLDVLELVIPLWALECAHFVASILGVWLLFTARGLLLRLDAAWWMALVLSAASLVLSLMKGLAYIEAGLLGFLIALLLATRFCFARPASLFRHPPTLGWLASVAAVLAVAFWIFFFAFRHVPYTPHLWWEFEFDEKAPRALRATVGAALFASAIGFWQMLRLAPGKAAPPSAEDLAEAARIVRGQERSDAVLAMMGDKSFLFSASRRAFLMYAKRGRSWVALYDPVGPREEWAGLIQGFVAMAQAHGGRAAFYQVRPDSLPLYLDAGLKLLKLGEEARIILPEFGLAGSRRANLRYALKRGERDGLSAEVIGPDAMEAALPELAAVSEAWLRTRQAREKGFSVAAFDPARLGSQSAILVRQHGRPVAFAAFMTTDLHREATVGAMRHVPDASVYAMEYLFTKLTLHLKDAGFSSLSLGMAPLAGLEPTPLARQWHRIAHLMCRYGGRLYNFQGLRTFKSKFNPVWEPRYLAASGNLGSMLALADVAVLAGGRAG